VRVGEADREPGEREGCVVDAGVVDELGRDEAGQDASVSCEPGQQETAWSATRKTLTLT
jgi:hypothetical protein